MKNDNETCAAILVDDLADPMAVDAFDMVEVEVTTTAQHEERNHAFLGR